MHDIVSDYLDHYLDEAPPGRGAVLLTGPWGAGKTHYINAYVARREAVRRRSDPLAGPVHLYASLYGARTPEDVSAQFFAQTNPLLNSGLARLLGTAASRTANALVRGQASKDGDGKRVRDFLLRDVGKLTLIFDDLERCAAPLSEMMGFINGFVEREGTKAILLASEADIPEDQRAEYVRRKEKLVSKTLEVRTDPVTVYRTWAGEMRCEAARRAARRNETSAMRTFEASRIGNLRSLRAVLDDFDRLVGGVDEALSRSDAALDKLLLFMVATGVEMRAGALRPEDLSALGSVRLSVLMSERGGRELTPERRALAATIGKYGEIEWGDAVVPTPQLAKLYAAGIVERGPIDEAILQHPLVADPGSVPSWRALWRWSELGVAEYRAERERFLADLGARAFVHPAEILHCAGIVIGLKRLGDDLLGGDPVDGFFTAYLDDLETTGALVPAAGALENLDGSGWAGLGFMASDSADFAIVRDAVEASARRRRGTAVSDAAPSFLASLRDGDQDFAGLYEHGWGNGAFGAVPVLRHLDVSQFADLCLIDGRPTDRLMSALFERYRRDVEGTIYDAEAPWLKALEAELARRAGALPSPHRVRSTKLIRRCFEQISACRDEARARAGTVAEEDA